MGGLNVGENHLGFVTKRRNGVSALHRRSKSASDKVNDSSRGVPHCVECNNNVSNESPISARTYASQSPHNGYSLDSSTSTSTHRASLEKDIHQLQARLQQEKSMRIMLEKAIGRASSTLSPGHRHFASQTKELIAEIELLEEEVANREQHVLSLYRNIFEQCVSRPPSEQSSGISSPTHVRKARKHPNIISSTFCSSKFPLRPFSSKGNSGKKDKKTRHSSLCMGKADVQYEKSCYNPSKVHSKSPAREKAAVLRTLKDHLHQCPSKLSEEMVRCMAEVYCWLYGVESTKAERLGNKQSFARSNSKSWANLSAHVSSPEDYASNPMVEIYSMPTDKSQFSRASYAINSYRTLVEQLERVDVRQVEAEAQIAFWINIYNALIMHAYLAYGIPHRSLRRLALFHKAAYNIGGLVISANAIEHAIFCFHTPRIGGWLETILSTAFRKKSAEEKQLISSKLSLPNSQSLACFALCTGAFSDPVLKVYTASNVRDELERAKREYLNTNIVVKKSKKVFLPRLLERYARESSIGSDDLLKWVSENVDWKLKNSIQQCIDSKNGKKASQIIEWLPYSSKFRYVFSQELATKPWWV